MQRPRFLHLRGADGWEACDHDGTRLHQATGTVRLAWTEAEQGERVTPGVFAAWQMARGGAVAVPCPPDRCADATALLSAAAPGFSALRPAGWVGLGSPSLPAAPAPGPLDFGDAAPATPTGAFGGGAALAADPWGRLWWLERGTGRLLVLAPTDLRLIQRVTTPWGVVGTDLGLTGHRALLVDPVTPAIWARPWAGPWARLAVDASAVLADLPALGGDATRWPPGYAPVAVAGGGDDLGLVVLRRTEATATTPPALAAIVRDQHVQIVVLPDLDDPLHVLAMPDGSFLVGEVGGPPGLRMLLTRFVVAADGLQAQDAWMARGFDGRALFLCRDGRPMATTARGANPVRPYQATVQRTGRVETWALDSERYGNQWHRLFLDLCLPSSTRVRIEARSSDELWPDGLRRLARPPTGWSADEEGAAGTDRVLGSRTPDDDEGWLPLPALDRRAAYADIPFRSSERALPSEDPLPRGPSPTDGLELVTLEGLLPTPPGRYLWLRLHLEGGRNRSPALLGLRATWPRPSLLAMLPAYWRAEPEAAAVMDRLLCLFEGSITELDARIQVLPYLLDPRTTPPEALSWLATFMAMSFDPRLVEGVRRSLLVEAAGLYRQRGTASGLRRLCEILTGGEVRIVEGFRLRRRTGSVLGVPDNVALGEAGSIVGPGMQLGGPEASGSTWEPWEARLVAAHDALLARRVAAAEAGASPCPPTVPTPALDPDPLIAWHRRYAHRFTVVLFARPTDELVDIVDRAVEAWKPAHTVHELCWLDTGFRLGVTTFVGLGTRLGQVATTRPAVLGQSAIGHATTLSSPSPTSLMGTLVGASRLGQSTATG